MRMTATVDGHRFSVSHTRAGAADRHQIFRHPADRTPVQLHARNISAEEVGVLTKGTVKVEAMHNTQLGDAVVNVQSVRNGTIGFSTVSASNLNQVVPAMDMYSLPFLFKNGRTSGGSWRSRKPPHWPSRSRTKASRSSPISIPARATSSPRRPIRSPDDMKGEKIRVMASPVMVNTMKALGATGVPVAWAELYTALQTGVVDGAENNHPSVVAKKFYEVSKYYTLDEHMRIPDTIIMSMKLWNQLNDDQKKAVLEAGTAGAGLYARRMACLRGEGSPGTQEQVHRNRDARQGAVREGGVGLVAEEGKRLGVEKTIAFILDSQKNF